MTRIDLKGIGEGLSAVQIRAVGNKQSFVNFCDFNFNFTNM